MVIWQRRRLASESRPFSTSLPATTINAVSRAFCGPAVYGLLPLLCFRPLYYGLPLVTPPCAIDITRVYNGTVRVTEEQALFHHS